ncbi:hypothetical protein HDZ31DRAFT_44602 [Schizophyllum fasciatum]
MICPACSLSFSDPTCVLLPPVRNSPPSSSIIDKVCIHLQTRYGAPARDVRPCIVTDSIRQYGRVRRLDAGDDMRASSLVPTSEDRRDATWVKYDLLVDRNARRRNAPPIFVPQSYFGQLENILVVEVSPSPALNLRRPETLILAYIHACHPCYTNSLGMILYDRMGVHEVVDITSVQCLVGRVPRRWPAPDLYAVVDRSSTVNRSIYVPDED